MREIANFRVENTSLITKGRLEADKRIGLSKKRNDTQPNRIVICKAENPKVQKLGLLLHIRKNIKAIGREPRGIRRGYESSESEPRIRIEPQIEAVKESGRIETGRWKSEGERNQESKKKKMTALRTKVREGKKNCSNTERSEPSNLSMNRTKGIVSTNKTTGERSRRATRTREARKSRTSTEGGEPSNRIKVNASANTKRDTEAVKLNTSRAGVKQPTNTTAGIHEPTLNSYISLNSKGAYYESPMYVTEQVKWEYTLMCMCDWKLIGRCMIVVNLKHCIWNYYPRKLVMSNVNNVGMMYDVTNIKIITTTIGKHHTSELRSFTMLKHACEFMCNQKICNSITKTVNNVVKLNQTISTNLYSKAKIQLSPQIKLWRGFGLRGNRKTSSTKLWKCSYFISISLYIGENMAATSTTNVDLEMGMVDENEINNFSQKRPTMAQVTISQKKAKGKMVVEPKRPPFWLGFQAMNWTNRSKDYPIDKMELISELIRKGMEIDEATKCQQATPSFQFVIQEEWPSIRGDGIEGQHFNLTQIPFDVEVDENGFALDYQIAIAFEIGDLKVSKENVMEKVKERLKKMKIAIGSMIGEPIAIMCYHKSTI